MKYFFILFLFFNIILNAQIKIIFGRVVSDINHSPIKFVNIHVIDKEIKTISGEEGKFKLEGDIKDHDIIVFSHVGFEIQRISADEFASLQNEIVLKSKIITSQTILVRGNIGQEGVTPLTFSKINQKNIKQIYTDQDIPELLSYQPSVTFYSENGNGLGYNYLSIRGFDQRRISVSINGIPQNDPEDHNVYWLDFPDLLESTELIQVQRGAGSGITGYPAIGGSINIITSSFSNTRQFELSTSLGDYNTRKYSLQYSSGLIDNKYSFYSKLSQTLSSGYRNSSWINFTSYHLSAIRFDDDITTQLNIYGGPISDGLAYTGLPKFVIKNKELRRANYSYWEATTDNYTFTLDRRPDEIENFSQPHFELLNEFKLNKNVTLNNAIFLVLGNGYFDYDGSWADTSYFRLTKENGIKANYNPTNSLIRAMVENKQWGWIPRINIKHDNGELIIGSELRFHKSLHWGSINYADNLRLGTNKDYRYYQFEGGKDILSFFINEKYFLNDNVNFLIETQLAYHRYKLFNEKYLNYEFEVNNLFFNPRLGVNYKLMNNFNVYASYSHVSREPRLNNYYDAAESSGGSAPKFELNSGKYDFSKPLVSPESMHDFELGSSYSNNNFEFTFNLYYMIFKNEIVKNGQVDRFGQPITGNINETIHYGLEAAASIHLNNIIQFLINFSLSNNYINEGYSYINYFDVSSAAEKIIKVNLSKNKISGFPNLTINAILNISYENLFAQISTKFVGEFYTDNYYNKLQSLNDLYPNMIDYFDNKVDGYFVSNLFASYDVSLNPVFEKIKIFFQVNNLFDNLYASYGIGKEFFPAAERNFLFGIKLGI